MLIKIMLVSLVINLSLCSVTNATQARRKILIELTDEIANMIIEKEGFAGKNRFTLNSQHRKTATEYGAYYDSKNYLTTGYGSLISKAPKGSEQEAKDIEKWQKTFGLDPFNLNKDQARQAMTRDYIRVMTKAQKQLGDLPINQLPPNVQKAVTSLAYNTGQLGPRTAALIKRANETKSRSDWEAVAEEFANWHGDKASQQPEGVLNRRKMEANWIKGTEVIEEDTEAQGPSLAYEIPEREERESRGQLDPTNKVEDIPEGYIEGNFRQPAVVRRERKDVIVDMTNTPYAQDRGALDLETKKAREIQANKPILERVGDFGNHLHNSFFTENVITDVADKGFKRMLGLTPTDLTFDPNFQPSSIPNFSELIAGMDNDQVKSILQDSPNRDIFMQRVGKFKLEQERRQEMSEYMQSDPVKGFLGIAAASALDVTSFLPVSNVSKALGVLKATKGLSATTRAIGGAIGKNVIEELVQESYLITNSEIRKFEDGDLLYGLIGTTVLSGAAGSIRAAGGLRKFENKITKYQAEKNLAGLETMLRIAERRKLPAKTISELQAVIKKTENDFTQIHRATVLNEAYEQQKKIGKGILETNRVDMMRKQSEFNTSIDKRIALEKAKPDPIQKVIRETKEQAKPQRTEMQEELSNLRQSLNDTKKILRREAAKKENGVARQDFLKDLRSKVDTKTTQIKDLQKKMKKAAKQITRSKTKAVKQAKKQVDPRKAEIARLEALKKEYTSKLKNVYAAKKVQVEQGRHPVQLDIVEPFNLERIGEELGLPVKFDSIDDLDEVIGLKFEDSVHKSAGAARVKYSGFAKGGAAESFFNKMNPKLWDVISKSYQEAKANPTSGLASHQVKKNSVYAKMLRATKINEFLTSESVVGRAVLNKSALRFSDNEFVMAFYDLLAPDSVGRAGSGKLSLMEKQQQLANIHGGTFRKDMLLGKQRLSKIINNHPQFQKDLGLPENAWLSKAMQMEVYMDEKIAMVLRDELIEPGSIRTRYGNEVGDIIEDMAKDFDKTQAALAKRMKDAGVLGAEDLAEGDAAKGWFHRTWDNPKVRIFHSKYGDKKLTELIDNSMKKHLVDNGIEISEEMAKDIKKQARKFGFGLHNADLDTNRAAAEGMESFLEDMIAKNKKGLDTDVLKEELAAVKDSKDRRKLRELGRRKQIDLNGSVTLDDGSTFYMKDLLEDNVFASQMRYIETSSSRIAAAEAGLDDIDLLDDWRQAAVDLASNQGKTDLAQYIDKSMRIDIRSFKYGTQASLDNLDSAFARLISMAKKYQFARLMQFFGISSISEVGSVIPEAGYKAVGEAVSGNVGKVVKTLFLGGITGRRFSDKLQDEMGVLTGVGLDTIGFDAMISSSDRLTRSKFGNVFERFVDNSAKLTQRATGHVETLGRQFAIRSLGISFGNAALGRSTIDSLWGGLSHRNLVEMGLADLGPDGKAVFNKKWTDISDAIKKHAVDRDGNLASDTGKPIGHFNIDKWDLQARRDFGDALTIQSNHIIVNPDSTTAKLWHASPVGSLYNQFRTFHNNAASKVAGHNIHQAIQGYNMGSMAEFSKTAQKMFWTAALGKLSLVMYGALNEAGRPDFEERMEKYLSVDDPRDWTRALGRGSFITGLDGPLDTTLGVMGIDPLFDNSTIGQSRNRFDILNTPTGQLLTGSQRILGQAAEGDFAEAGEGLIKLSPLRRAIGVNQLLNSMGLD